jgi:RNA polymerase sigma-70 factor, ECF subfamily
MGELFRDANHSVSASCEVKDTFGKDPHDTYLTKLNEAMLRDAIEALPPPYRDVIVLRVFDDLSYSDIAKALDCPIGTVMSRVGGA